jgi:hypothetical protein
MTKNVFAAALLTVSVSLVLGYTADLPRGDGGGSISGHHIAAVHYGLTGDGRISDISFEVLPEPGRVWVEFDDGPLAAACRTSDGERWSCRFDPPVASREATSLRVLSAD